MTHAEIIQKVKDTFKAGDQVFYKDQWYYITSICDRGTVHIRTINAGFQKNVQATDALKYFSFTEYTLEPVGFSQERPKPKKKNGDPFEVGDEVWSVFIPGIYKGVIKAISNEYNKERPLVVHFENYFSENSKVQGFGPNGEGVIGGDLRLFHQKPILTFED